ncbi:Asp-tRNA(Asn)/Glu-tRNA(Gln) amidotransferase subunit GatA [Candidatus Roizmanbacteria bacterium]|nr:Asp-tRNA(Asn)/Glu-tRNA(Gln) amidotransferase subunit GatA [Candidatus Roizmanbacteria bacterium]
MNLLGKTITQLKLLLEKKEVSAEELFSYFSKRTESFDSELNCYLTTVPFEKNESEGLLTGIPLAVKDNFCTNGVRTTASAKVLDQFVPPYDATVISKLKSAGAHILGKTNMDAWAHGSSTETSDYGPTHNPWDTTRAPGGSSGGSAAAVSAYLSPAAIGSETAGSIRQPASWTGVVGLKPTYGRVSRYGVIAMGSSLDCPGPLTLNTEDSALILQVLAGKDPQDATSSEVPVDNYIQAMKQPRKMVIGVADEYFEGIDEGVKERIMSALKVFESQGHTIKKVKLISPKYAISVYTILQRAEVSSNLARYDGIRYGNDRTFFGTEAKRRTMLGTYTLSYGYYDAFYKKAQKVRTMIIEDFKRVFQEVDVIAAPTTPITALKLGEFEKYPFFGEMMDVLNEPGAVSGIPAINVPCGFDTNNLPVGLQFMGNYFEEGTLLNLSYQFEKETEFFGVIKEGLARYSNRHPREGGDPV